jgi:hypothetical protein
LPLKVKIVFRECNKDDTSFADIYALKSAEKENMKRQTPRIRKILIPVDFSAYSESTVTYASMIAERLKATLILMHVIDSLPYSVTDTFNVIEHRKALQTLASALQPEHPLASAKNSGKKTPCLGERESADPGRGAPGKTGFDHLGNSWADRAATCRAGKRGGENRPSCSGSGVDGAPVGRCRSRKELSPIQD